MIEYSGIPTTIGIQLARCRDMMSHSAYPQLMCGAATFRKMDDGTLGLMAAGSLFARASESDILKAIKEREK